LCLLSCVGYINFYQTPGILWELLGTLHSRWTVHFSGNCVPAVKKVRELSSCAFPLKLSPELPLPKGAELPVFGRCLLWPSGWMDQDCTWHGGGPRSRPHCARWGPSFPPQKGGPPPEFLAHFCGSQTAGCIKMPLGMEVGLGPGNIVLDGDPTAPPPKRGTPPIFGPCLLWPNGCVYQDTTWYGGRPQTRRHCYDNMRICKFIALWTANVYSAKCEMSASACSHSIPNVDSSMTNFTFIVEWKSRLLKKLNTCSCPVNNPNNNNYQQYAVCCE